MIDVLIIGSGGAGLSAALEAKQANATVLVVSKTFPTHSQTCQAQGGINAFLYESESDSVENYINDTLKSSYKLANKKNIEFLCINSKENLNWLDSLGVPFSRKENSQISQRKFGGTKAQRTCYSSDYTGLKILHTLYDQCIKNEIEFLNEHFLLDLIVEENCVKGALFLNIIDSSVVEIYAKTVILATGGYAGLYHNFTTNSYSSTGDGITAAFKSGVKLSNMEYVQFHPTALENKNILVSESARGEGGYLVDEEGTRFIDELKPRDEVARAIYEKNILNQRVFLDLRHLGIEKINSVMPQERRLIHDFMKLKMEEDLIPINPSAHYTMGGILSDISTQTSIENLYACGECSQSGVHGANRLGGNSLLEIVTFGRVAGRISSQKSKELKESNLIPNKYKKTTEHRIIEILNKEIKKDFYKAKNRLGEILFKNVGLFRDETKLNEALRFVNELKNEQNLYGVYDKSKIYNKNLVEYLEFENMILLANIIIQSAINRKESRGAHYRTDYKEINSVYEKNSVSIIKDGQIINYFEEVL